MWRRIRTIFWRDFSGFFYNPAAYVTIFGFLFVNGLVLHMELSPFRSGGDVDLAIRMMFGNFFFWILMLAVPPIVTMRLLAEERRSNTVELLMTAPVRTWEVVLGKYMAGFLFTAFIWSLLLVDIAVIAVRLATMPGPVGFDWGKLVGIYCGILGLQAFFVALGLLASAVTRNQIVAAVLGLGMNLVVFFVGQYHQLFARSQYESLFLSFISVISHFVRDFSMGIVDLRYLCLYLIMTAACLFVTTWTFGARQWR